MFRLYVCRKKEQIFLERRIEIGEDYGFDGHKMFMADQLDKKGTYFEITDEYVEASSNGLNNENKAGCRFVGLFYSTKTKTLVK